MKALCFDLHGILIEKFPKGEYEEKVRSFLKEKNLDYDQLKSEYGTMSWAMKIKHYQKEYLEILDGMPVEEQEDTELIGLLKDAKNKYDLYIVTDSSWKNTIETLKKANIDSSLFNKIITGSDVSNPKPETEPYEKILEEGYNPDEVLVFGDRITDLIPAQKLGMVGILCNYNQFKEVLKWML